MKKPIILGKFYQLVKNRLNLSRYPKSKIKQTGLALHNKMWYFGVTYNPKGDKKVDWIPYLSGKEAHKSDVVSGEPISKETKKSDKYNDKQKRTLSTIGQKWNYDEFDYARQPIDIGTVMDRYAFSSPMPNVVNLPIKMAGDDTIYLPVEYEGMNEALNKIFTYGKTVNPNYSDYYAYLTVDKFLENSQSRVKYHVDGFESADQTDQTVQHNYTVSNVEVPNKFVVEPMDTGDLNGETVGKWFDSFTRQSEHVKKVESIPLHIYLYDAYQVHKSTQSMDGYSSDRNYTHMSVSFTKEQKNRIGNGINPLINEEWTYTPQDMEAEVTT